MLTEQGGTAICFRILNLLCTPNTLLPMQVPTPQVTCRTLRPKFRWYNGMLRPAIVRRLLIVSIEVMADGNQVQPHVIQLVESFDPEVFRPPIKNL